MKKLNKIGNIEINEKKGYAYFSVNTSIYPLDIIYSAAYILIDKAFIILDGDPKKEILVEIRKKEERQDLQDLVQAFNEELLNYAAYKVQSEKNKTLREIMLQRILLINDPNYFIGKEKSKEVIAEDPKKVMESWGEDLMVSERILKKAEKGK